MNRDDIRNALLRILCDIAPEWTPDTIPADVDLRDELDLDSMDFQRYLVKVAEELHVDMPNRAYEQFSTLKGGVDYVADATTAAQKIED